MIAALFAPGWSGEARGAGGSLTFEPDEMILANVGDKADVSVVHSGLGERLNGFQLNLQHDASVAIREFECRGAFAGVFTLSTSIPGGSLVGCVIIGSSIPDISGLMAVFSVERIAPGDSQVVLDASGGPQTIFTFDGSAIGTGTLGSLSVITSGPTPTPGADSTLTPQPSPTAIPTATPTAAPGSTPAPAATRTPTPTPASAPDATSTALPEPTPTSAPGATVAPVATQTPSPTGGATPTNTASPRATETRDPVLATATAAVSRIVYTTVIVTRLDTATPASGGSNTPSPAPTAQPGSISPTSAPVPVPVPTPATVAPELIAQQPEATPAGALPDSTQDLSPTAVVVDDEEQESSGGGTCNGTDGGINMGILGILGLPALIGARKLRRNG